MDSGQWIARNASARLFQGREITVTEALGIFWGGEIGGYLSTQKLGCNCCVINLGASALSVGWESRPNQWQVSAAACSYFGQLT